MTTVGGIRTPATIEVLDLELYGIISCVLAEQSGHYYTVAVLCQINNVQVGERILHTPQMGNRPPKQHHPSRPMKSFEQLKLDVDRANHVFGRAELHLSANYLSTLVFQILIANKANRALLPVTWKFNNNIVVKVTSSEDTLLLAHFNPKSFYTLFSIMIELETSIRVRGDQPPLPPPEAEEMEKSSSEVVEVRQSSYDDNECALCMDAQVDVVTPCAHAFCNTCLADWKQHNPDMSINPTCPLCRAPLAREDSADRLWVLDATTDSDAHAKDLIVAQCARIMVMLESHQVKQTK